MGEGKPFDFEERSLLFAQRVRQFVKGLPRTICNVEDVRQLARCSASVGANYIEANDSLSKKDRIYRMRIARKEARESRFFLRLLDTSEDGAIEQQRASLIDEAGELIRILSTMIARSSA